MEKMTDFLGHEYGVGDYITYVTVSGHTPNVAMAKVLEFIPYIQKRGYWDYSGERGVYIEDEPTTSYRLKVQPLLDARLARWSTDKNGINKQVTLSQLTNVCLADVSMADFVEPA